MLDSSRPPRAARHDKGDGPTDAAAKLGPSDAPDAQTPVWSGEVVLKADIFGQIELGTYGGVTAICRDTRRVPWWSRPLAGALFRRELRALRRLEGVAGVPQLLGAERRRLFRTWQPGVPVHIARPHGDLAFFRDAKRLLRTLHRLGVAHNDLAKEQNWLRGQDGRPIVIDFQLATLHRRRTKLFRVLAREDIRHLIKIKARYCPDALTPSERHIKARKSLPARIWLRTGKKVYNFVTRRLLRWSDGEGTVDRRRRYGDPLAARLAAHPAVSEAVVCGYPQTRRVEGLYAFVVASAPVDPAELEAWAAEGLGQPGTPDHLQLVERLPKAADGTVRLDILDLVARNLVGEIPARIGADPALESVVAPIVAGRRNFTDRFNRTAEPPKPT